MVDIPANNTTTATITVGGSTTNSLEVSGDHDWFKISLTSGQAITVALNGITLEDPYLRIRDSSGTVIYSNDDINTGVNLNSLLSFQANYSGIYYIDVGSYESPQIPGGTGDYQLNVTTWTPPPLWTNDQIAQQLVTGYWGDGMHRFVLDQTRTITVNITGLDFNGQNLAITALQQWSSITGINFVQTSGAAQITFTDDDPDGGAFTESTYSSANIATSHVNIDAGWLTTYGSNVGSYSYQAYLHEIGHALGLGHAGNYNTTANYPYDALYQNDAWSTSVMSYFSQTENTYFAGQGFDDAFLVTPMVADILAMQQMYGLSTTTRSGDTTYGFNSNAGNPYNAAVLFNVAYTIFDTGGTDTMDFSGYDVAQVLNLNPESFSSIGTLDGNVSIARGTIIENAIGGGGADAIIGNGVANVLTGGDGNDTLTGGMGNDTFQDTKAGLNGDTITDFSLGDKIVFTDATLSGFTFNLSGSALTFTGGSLTLTAPVIGTIVAASAAGGGVQLTITPPAQFNDATLVLSSFGIDVGGWSSNDTYPRLLADVNGDNRDDIVGFGNDGVYVSLANSNGTFANPVAATSAFGFNANAGGWSSFDRYPRQVADVNGDGRADVIGFGNDGVYVSLGQLNGSFAAPTAATTAFGFNASAGGWSSNDRYPRVIADVNGDSRADIIGFGNDGVYVSLGQANGSFAAPIAATTAFGFNPSAGGWSSNNTYPRMAGDVNNDGRADIVGFGNHGVYVSLGQANGTFSAPNLVLQEFGAQPAGGDWISYDRYPRELADVNDDGRLDIVGFGNNGVYIAYGNGNGTFQASVFDLDFFGYGPQAGNWTSENIYPRHLGDVNGDGAADLVGFYSSGVYVALSNGDIF